MGYRIALIDRFYPPPQGFASDEDKINHGWLYGMVDLDADQQREPFYHGDLVQMIAAHPKLLFLRFPIRDGQPPMAEILSNLRQIRINQARRPIDALLLCWESSSLISAFERPLRLEHASHYRALVRDWGLSDPVWHTTYQIILQLQALARDGVRVFTIAGNGGRGMVNTFSFADGVTTVGASEPELSHFIASNAFVNRRAPAAYQFRRLDDGAGNPLGYDLNGDGCTDIPLQRLSGYGVAGQQYPKNYWQALIGSSFAAPAALKAELAGENQQCLPQ
ncbi:hypothetical protein K6T12_05645 [Marinobacterium sp. CAU 1594]|nr:hypothetical protein [Marinobacterium arenosum]